MFYIQIFTKSFVVSQKTKELSWMQKIAAETGLEIDDDLKSDLGISSQMSSVALEDQKMDAAVKKARSELKALLDTPIVSEEEKRKDAGSSTKKNKSFIVVAK